jgi:hypothetical protein
MHPKAAMNIIGNERSSRFVPVAMVKIINEKNEMKWKTTE